MQQQMRTNSHKKGWKFKIKIVQKQKVSQILFLAFYAHTFAHMKVKRNKIDVYASEMCVCDSGEVERWGEGVNFQKSPKF